MQLARCPPGRGGPPGGPGPRRQAWERQPAPSQPWAGPWVSPGPPECGVHGTGHTPMAAWVTTAQPPSLPPTGAPGARGRGGRACPERLRSMRTCGSRVPPKARGTSPWRLHARAGAACQPARAPKAVSTWQAVGPSHSREVNLLVPLWPSPDWTRPTRSGRGRLLYSAIDSNVNLTQKHPE